MKNLILIILFVFLSSCGSYIGFGGSGEFSCRFVERKDLKNESIIDIVMVNQNYTNYCGPASLEMVLKFYGETYSQNELAELMGISDKGVSPNQILETSRSLTYTESSKANCELNVLLYTINRGIPVIVRTYDATFSNAHYMVVVGYNIEKEELYVNDPAYFEFDGYRTYSFDDFQDIWNINTLGGKHNSFNLMLIIK